MEVRRYHSTSSHGVKGGDTGESISSSYSEPIHLRSDIEVQQYHSASSLGDKDAEAALYRELWYACAGPLITVPQENEHVLYFPQGHIEQIEVSTNQPADQKNPFYNLPSKILCRVIKVILKADPITDEVFAEVTLLPEPNQDENAVTTKLPTSSSPKFHIRSFCKILSPSDASTNGGLIIPKQHGNECLPQLDMSSQYPSQELVSKDLHGNEWRFCHTFRGYHKRHMLQGGWNVFATCKKLVAGDAFIFLRGENEELKVGVRKLKLQQGNIQPSVISSHNMYVGVLATAWQSISTKTMFTIYYKPRTSPANFLIPLNQYKESIKMNYSIGMKFQMRFEAKETHKQRFTGTVVGIEDANSNMWQESKWRCLKVCWDERSHIPRPNRVSPWEIEPIVLPSPLNTLLMPMPKRPRPSMVHLSADSYVEPTEGFEASSNSSNRFCAPLIDQTIATVNPTTTHVLHEDENLNLLDNQQSLMSTNLSLKLVESNQDSSTNDRDVNGQWHSNTKCTVLSEYPSLCGIEVDILNGNGLITYSSSSHLDHPDHSKDSRKKPSLAQEHENGKSVDRRYQLFGISLI